MANPNMVPQLIKSGRSTSASSDDCSFSVVGSNAWNSLLDHVQKATSLETFKSQLKLLFLNNHVTVINTLLTHVQRHFLCFGCSTALFK